MDSQATLLNTVNTSSNATSVVLLTFKVGHQRYGLPVTNIVRIIEMVTIIDLPHAPEPIQGVINVRGKVVPVMDMRHRFNLARQAYGLRTPIILIDMAGGQHILGLIVDEVDQVLEVEAQNLEIIETFIPAELTGQMAGQAAYLAGIAKVNRQMILVLNPHTLLSPSEHNMLSYALNDETQAAVKNEQQHTLFTGEYVVN